MGLFSLLFSFNGRINRAQFWLGSLGVVAFGVVAVMVLVVTAGLSALDAKSGDQAVRDFLSAAILVLPLFMLMSWCSYALQVKRFHDRGRSGFLTLIPAAVATVMMLALFQGALTGQSVHELEQVLQPYVMVSWLINIAFFIDLGCLPGKEGPNRFGSPPGSPPSGAPYAPANTAPTQGAAPANALLSAQSAMDRAIAERAREPQGSPAMRTAVAAPSSGGAPSFGRRATH